MKRIRFLGVTIPGGTSYRNYRFSTGAACDVSDEDAAHLTFNHPQDFELVDEQPVVKPPTIPPGKKPRTRRLRSYRDK